MSVFETEVEVGSVDMRLRTAVSGYGRRGDIVTMSIEQAAGLMENHLADVHAFSAQVVSITEVPDEGSESAAEPGGNTRRRPARRKAGSGDDGTAGAEPGEGPHAG